MSPLPHACCFINNNNKKKHRLINLLLPLSYGKKSKVLSNPSTSIQNKHAHQKHTQQDEAPVVCAWLSAGGGEVFKTLPLSIYHLGVNKERQHFTQSHASMMWSPLIIETERSICQCIYQNSTRKQMGSLIIHSNHVFIYCIAAFNYRYFPVEGNSILPGTILPQVGHVCVFFLNW